MRPGHIGIVYNRFGGISEQKKCTEGMNFILPWFQRAIIYDIRTRPQLINTQSGSKGQKNVPNTSNSLFFRCHVTSTLISRNILLVQISK